MEGLKLVLLVATFALVSAVNAAPPLTNDPRASDMAALFELEETHPQTEAKLNEE